MRIAESTGELLQRTFPACLVQPGVVESRNGETEGIGRQDGPFELRLAQVVAELAPQEPLIPALRREILTLVRHCTSEGGAELWRMIDASPALRQYEVSMRLRHAELLTAAIAVDLDLPQVTTAVRTIARFVIDAHSLARESADPEAAVDEIFQMIQGAWDVVSPTKRSTTV